MHQGKVRCSFSEANWTRRALSKMRKWPRVLGPHQFRRHTLCSKRVAAYYPLLLVTIQLRFLSPFLRPSIRNTTSSRSRPEINECECNLFIARHRNRTDNATMDAFIYCHCFFGVTRWPSLFSHCYCCDSPAAFVVHSCSGQSTRLELAE